MPDAPPTTSGTLSPYLPRLTIQWLTDEPGQIVREVDGSVTFVDISGFTKMSERLARKGKIGAEEVTDVLASVFGRLLAVAYGNGGGLIKFGGDALLLFFDGNDHPTRAARAAAGMRATLRRIGAIDTSAGKIRLRMSVGVHSGTFDFFLVGTSHRELMITGPAASQTVLMEGTAEAGEVLVSRSTAAELPKDVLGAAKGEGILLKREPGGIAREHIVSEPRAEGLDLLSCIPVAIREHLLSEAADPEHRQATVAFVHFDGVDRFVEDRGASELAVALQSLVGTIQVAAAQHNVTFLGTDVDHDGGKVILVAGVPQAYGDDEERMLLTLRSVIDSRPPIPVRIGVNRGPIFAGDIGPGYRKTYTVMGDAVNLAARLMARAEPGQILATADVLDPCPVEFETTALEPFLVKGKRDPVRAFSVGPVTGSKQGRPDRQVTMVGREPEMGTLLEGLEASRLGRGRLIEIVGDAGIGKTRLLTELRAAASTFDVFDFACELYGASVPYLPFRRVLRQALEIPDGTASTEAGDRLRRSVEELVPELEAWLPLIALTIDADVPATPEVEQLDPEFRRRKLEEVVGLLAERLFVSPTLFAIEDVHWMDEASTALLHQFARSLDSSPWLICVTRRDEPGGFAATESDASLSLRPQPLTLSNTQNLVMLATEDAPLHPHEMATLAERSGGNPLFLLELIHAAREAGGVDHLPGSVEAIVTAQIDRLAPADRRLLRYASVLGLSFADALIDTVLGMDHEAVEEAAWLRLGEFVDPEAGGGHRFRHALMRDAAYEGLPFRRRRELHARAGEAIVQAAGANLEEHAELLSMHFFDAQRFGEAWIYSRIAGDRAQAKFAIVQATEFYERALGSANRLDDISPKEIGELHETVGDLRERIGQYDEASAAYRAARALFAGDPARQAGIFLKQAWIPDRSGRSTEALRWLSRGLRVLEGRDDDESARQRARLTSYYGAVRQSQGRHSDAIRLLEQAIEEAKQVGDRDGLAHAYYMLDWALIEAGLATQPVYSAQALAIYEELGNLGRQASILNNMGVLAQWAGRWDEAIELLTRAREAREKLGDVVDAAFCSSNLAEILSDRGELDEAEALFTEALRVHRSAEYLTGIGFATSNLGRIASRRGNYEEAAELFEQARTVFGEAGFDSEVLETDLRRAELLLMQQRGEEALSFATEALERVRSLGGAVQEPGLHRVRGYSFMQAGTLGEAREALEDSLQSARGREATFEVGLTLDALVRLNRLEGVSLDPALEAEAREIFERLRVTHVQEIPLPSLPARAGAGRS